MSMASEEALGSTDEKANFQRLTRLLMCGGVTLLRETFDSIHSPTDLPLKLGNPAIQAKLRGARLTKPEWDCLYPSPGLYGKSTDFDITLVFRLLRTICNLTPPPGPRGWDDLPNIADHSLQADLARIKYYRNEVYGHNKTMEIPNNEFVRLWEEISKALLRIAANISLAKRDEWKKSIDDLRHNPLTPREERYVEELETWYRQEIDVKHMLEKLEDEVNTLRKEPRTVILAIQVNVVNNSVSFPRTGLSEAAGSEGMCTVPICCDQAQTTAGALTERSSEDHQPNASPEIHIWNVVLSFKESLNLFFEYLRCKLNVFVRNYDVGSLLLIVECSSLQILEGLWEEYCSGHLNSMAQKMLITPQVLEKLGLTEVKLKTFISEEEYEKGKQMFKDDSENREPIPEVTAEPATRARVGQPIPEPENWEVGSGVIAQPTNRARVRQRRIELDPGALQQPLRTQIEKMAIARKLKAREDEWRKKEVTLMDIVSIKHDAGTFYLKLGAVLGIDKSRMGNYDKSEDRGFHVLNTWKNMKGKDATFGNLYDALIKVKETECAEKLLATQTPTNEPDKSMDEKHRKLLKIVKEELVRDMDPEDVLLKMSASFVFSDKDEDEIKSEPTRRRKCEALLRILPTKGSKAYDSLKQALEEYQPHLANLIIEAENREPIPQVTAEQESRARVGQPIPESENWEVGSEVTAQPTNRSRVRQRRIESDPDVFQQLLRTQLEKMAIARKLKENRNLISGVLTGPGNMATQRKPISETENSEVRSEVTGRPSNLEGVRQLIRQSGSGELIPEVPAEPEHRTRAGQPIPDSGNSDLASEVTTEPRNRTRRRHPISESENQVTAHPANRARVRQPMRESGTARLTQRHVLKICDEVGTCWQDLGKTLKLLPGTLRKVDFDYNLSREKAREMLYMWMRKEGDNATVGKLTDALRNIGRERIAEKLLGM